MERPLARNEVTRLGPDSKFHHAGLRRGLTPATLRKLDAISRLRVFPRDAVVVPQGGALEYVGNVVRGVLRMERLLSDGRSQIVGLLVPSDMFGRVFSERSDYSIEAATEVTLCCFERHAFEALVRTCPDLEHAVLLAVLDEPRCRARMDHAARGPHGRGTPCHLPADALPALAAPDQRTHPRREANRRERAHRAQ